jgi:sortase A
MRHLGSVRAVAAIGALVGLLALTGCGRDAGPTAAAADRADSTPAPTSAAPTTPAPTSTVTTTTTVATTIATTPTQLTLPQPAPAPDPNLQEPPFELGRIQIPKIGVDQSLWEGVSLSSLDRGPGHWPGTAMPGQLGNVVIGGHRVSHDHPFRHIDQLVPGDQIIMTMGGVQNVYDVTSAQVVTPNDIWVINQTPAHTATLFACHPPGSTRLRYVVFAKLAGT